MIVGGINGAGQTTPVEELRGRPGMKGALFRNPDQETAAAMAADPQMTPGAAQFLGLRIVLEAVHRALAEDRSVVTETVFASAAALGLMRTARSRGFGVRLVFVGAPTVEDAIARVANRVARGGHHVPEADMRRRWPRARSNLSQAVEIDVFADVGAEPRLMPIAMPRQGRVTIQDRDTLPAVTAALDHWPTS